MLEVSCTLVGVRYECGMPRLYGMHLVAVSCEGIVHVCMSGYIYIYIHICMCVYIYTYIYIFAYIHTHMYMCVCKHECMHKRFIVRILMYAK